MAKSKTDIIFPAFSGSISNISAEFASENEISLIQARGLQDGDEVRIEVAFADDCDVVTWIPFVDCCGQVKMRYPQTFLILPIPLRYRAVLVDIDGEYLVDPARFINVQLRFNRISTNIDLTKFYHGCCSTGNGGGGVGGNICDMINSLPVAP